MCRRVRESYGASPLAFVQWGRLTPLPLSCQLGSLNGGNTHEPHRDVINAYSELADWIYLQISGYCRLPGRTRDEVFTHAAAAVLRPAPIHRQDCSADETTER